jgi:hypothetical protein
MEETIMGQSAPSPAKIAQCLKGLDFPVPKEGLVAHAEDNAADPAVVEALQRLPSGPYANMADVANAVRHLP